MNRHTCKLCFRRFPNGRALGGHMRSHVTSATTTHAKLKLQDDRDIPPSQSSSKSASHGDQGVAKREAEVEDRAAEEEAEAGAVAVPAGVGGVKQLVCYGVRENPSKSCRLADPEFSSTFAATVGSSVVLHDQDSETESKKPPCLRRRSSGRRRPPQPPPPNPEPSFESERVSSVSDATPAAYVARCLMMLSRDAWSANSAAAAAAVKRKTPDRGGEVAKKEGKGQPSDGSEEERVAVAGSRRGGRRRHRCGACGKLFRSYQALGGHRASHRNVGACVAPPTAFVSEGDGAEFDRRHVGGHQIRDAASEANALPSTGSAGGRTHECPVCFRVFGTGQALDGHKRSHLAYCATDPSPPPSSNAAAAAAAEGSPIDTNFSKQKFAEEGLIDLNLPAPMDEEVATSAVFDV